MQRHPGPELLDNEDIPKQDLYRNLFELDVINTYLGGHDVSIVGLKKILQHKKNTHSLTIADLGCGGGDTLRALAIYCRQKKIHATFYGIDIKKDCIEYAQSKSKAFPEIQYIQQDYAKINMKFDIICAALFNHHFTNDENIQILTYMQSHAHLGWFINDLHRHPLAKWSIALLTRLFSSSYLVKNDAPLSVERGFLIEEWKKMLQEAHISKAQVDWKWAFRHLIYSVKPDLVKHV